MAQEWLFSQKQHFFKPLKICHLCDDPSHQTGHPYVDDPNTACPDTENPDTGNPCLENQPQLNKDKRNTEFIKYKRIKSYPISPQPRRRQLDQTELNTGQESSQDLTLEKIWQGT